MTTNFTRRQARSAIMTFAVEQMEAMKRELEQSGDIQEKELAIYYENNPKPDMDKFKYLVEVSIEFNETEQVDINPNPTIRSSGIISIVVGVRVGGGTIVNLSVADFVHQNFRRQWLESVRTLTPRDVGSYELDAWNFKRIDVPFRFDAKDFIN